MRMGVARGVAAVSFLIMALCGPALAETDIPALLKPFVENHTLAGAVTLVANKEKVLALDAVGYADIANQRPMRADDLFWIASMSKPMTSTCLMMLVDDGKVNLDDPVEKYLPEFKGQMLTVEQDADHVLLKKPAHPITVREILSHTSGQPFKSRVEPHIDTYPLSVAVLTYALTPLKFPPGSKYDYSNAGINTAGRIIEVVSGMPYERFMSQRLLEPLVMKDTTCWPNAQQIQRLAKSYKPGPNKTGLIEIQIDQLTYPLDDPRRGPSPAGGYFSTAADVGTFGRMILCGGVLDGKRYLSENAVREMTSTQTGGLLNGGKGENGYGLGFSTARKARNDAVIPGPTGHGGAYATNLSIDPQRGLVTVFMVQAAGYPTGGEKAQGVFNQAAQSFAK
jgi:CubicO group peptidase (beta-lactamase class C family)